MDAEESTVGALGRVRSPTVREGYINLHIIKSKVDRVDFSREPVADDEGESGNVSCPP
jgi:hypothetical protein